MIIRPATVCSLVVDWLASLPSKHSQPVCSKKCAHCALLHINCCSIQSSTLSSATRRFSLFYLVLTDWQSQAHHLPQSLLCNSNSQSVVVVVNSQTSRYECPSFHSLSLFLAPSSRCPTNWIITFTFPFTCIDCCCCCCYWQSAVCLWLDQWLALLKGEPLLTLPLPLLVLCCCCFLNLFHQLVGD